MPAERWLDPEDDDATLLAACAVNFATPLLERPPRDGTAVGRAGGLAWSRCPAHRTTILNGVVPCPPPAPDAARVPVLLARFGDDGPVSWHVDPGPDRAALEVALVAAGASRTARMPIVAGPAAGPVPGPPAGVELHEVARPGDHATFVAVAAAGFGLDEEVVRVANGWIPALVEQGRAAAIVATLDGEPVGVGVVVLAGGVAGLYSMTVLPHARRRGVGAALAARRLELAAARGARTAFIVSAGDAEPIYARRGFRRIGERWVFVRPGRGGS